MELTSATQATMYFIGVTTGKSSIMKVFPEWAKALGLKDTVMKGIDLPIHADPEEYRKVAQFLKDDPLSMGALVTTHKIDMYNACHDMFDYIDPYAKAFGELSCISKKDGQFRAHAKDPITCGMAMEEFVPENYWKNNPEAELYIMGAGGSAISMCAYYMKDEAADNHPARIVVANRSQKRLDELAEINEGLNKFGIPCDYHLTPEPGQNDEVLKGVAPGSLIINATGLGKDRPGSPLQDSCVFPEKSIVWEINYRGDLRFMHQALEQQAERQLVVEDGWMYFIFGWTQVIAEVFHMEILGERLRECEKIAAVFNERA